MGEGMGGVNGRRDGRGEWEEGWVNGIREG